MSEEIAESLREISTPTGLSYSGDRTLDNSYTEEIIDYINSLQQKVEQLESIRKEATEYINHATIGADSSPIEDSWLYNLYETRNILNKGDNNGRK